VERHFSNNSTMKQNFKSGLQFSVDYTLFYRPHGNSMLFVIFPAEITAAQSLHFQHLMWTDVMVQDVYSKEKPFVSNVHINI
jgi:hypothetical protein